MKRQRNTFQTKQDKTSEKELNKTEISNLPAKEFKVIIIKMLTELGRRIDELKWELQQRENIKKNQWELKNTITEVKINTTDNQQIRE